MNSQPGEAERLAGLRARPAEIPPVIYAWTLTVVACSGRTASGFDPKMTSPLPVEWSGRRSWGEPDRDDKTSPQTSVVAAIILLVHVRGEVGLQDEPTEALADQTTDRDLALLQVTLNRRIEITGPTTRPNSQSPNFLVAVRSTFRKSGLQPFSANGAGHGDSCGLPVTWSK